MLRVGIDDLDEGYFAQQATRVLHGQIPYRDFDSLYTPGLLYLHAGLFALLGGPSLIVLRVVALAGRIGMVGLTYALTCSLARPRWALAAAVFPLIGLDTAPERWETHPAWLSTALALLGVYVFPRWAVATGVIAGLAFVFKQNTGVFLLGAALAWTWLTRASGHAWLGRAARLLAGFAMVTLVWLVPLVVAVDGQIGRLSAFVGGVNQAALFVPPEFMDLLPVTAGGLGAWYLWRRCPHPRLAWYVLAGAFLFLTEFPRMDAVHLVWSGPMLLVVGAIALDGLSTQAGVLALTALVLASLQIVTGRAAFLREATQPVGVRFAEDLRAPPRTGEELRSLVGEIQSRTAPDEPIFVYPTSPLLYVVAERPNPTRYDHFYPGAAPPFEVQRAIDELADVRLVVISDYWTFFFGTGGDNAPLDAYLAENYQEVARFGAYHVLERPILAHVFGAESAGRRD